MTTVEHRGRTYGLGARQRPFDIREIKYRLAAPPVVDLSRARSVAQWRGRIEDQGQMGSCVACAVTSGAELLARKQGAAPEELDRLWLYYHCRVKEGSYPEDAGSYPADACDFAMAGLPAERIEPLGYITDPRYVPPQVVEDSERFDYVQGHQPIYSTDPGGFLAGLWHALDQGMPVVVAMGWRNEFFEPPDGVLPTLPNAGIIGGHAMLGVTYTPPTMRYPRGLVWCDGSWSEEWTRRYLAAMRALNPDAVPGVVGIPGEHFENGVVWELRALSPEPVTPQPQPEPVYHADYALAEGIVGGVRDGLKAQWDRNHRSATAHYRYLGAQDAVQALIEGRP